MPAARRAVVRLAVHSDRAAIVDLGRRFHIESAMPLPFCADHAAQVAAQCIAGADRLALLAELDGVPSGLLLAGLTCAPFSPLPISQELAWWLAPSVRGRAGLRMLAAYEAWARSKDCAAIGLAGLSDPRVERFYRARGFVPFERHFLKVLT
jgi:GNAT superfamily N-acetyltransferase